MAEADPAAASLSDEAIEARLVEMASNPMLDPTPIEGAVDRWAAVESWDRLVAIQLSDDMVEKWMSGFLLLMTE